MLNVGLAVSKDRIPSILIKIMTNTDDYLLPSKPAETLISFQSQPLSLSKGKEKEKGFYYEVESKTIHYPILGSNDSE